MNAASLFPARASRSRPHGLLLALALFGFCLSLSGCGGQGVPVHGHVTLDGAPLSAGTIKFIPEAGVPGPTVSAEIEGGEYAFGSADGPVAGPYRVEIYADAPLTPGLDDPQEFLRQGGALKESPNPIAPRFNRETTLRALVETGGGRKFDFAAASGVR